MGKQKEEEGDKEEEEDKGEEEGDTGVEDGELFKEAGGVASLKKLSCFCTENATPGIWIQKHNSHYIISIQRTELLHRPKLWNRSPEELSTNLHRNTYFCDYLYFLFV